MRIDLTHCPYCGGPADSYDHVVPLSIRRPDDDKLLIACCMTCNTKASNHLFESFEAKAKFMLNLAITEGRIKWPQLLQSVNIVTAILNRREVGNASAPPNADTTIGLCETCGSSIERRYKHPKKFCSPICSEIKTRERRRR